MSRLGTIVRRMLAADRTMGSGLVSQIVRSGEVRLEGRQERVLVAGCSMPQVGEWIPWITVESGLLVATHNLPQPMPAPVIAGEPQFAGRWAHVVGQLLDPLWYWQQRPGVGEDSQGNAWVNLVSIDEEMETERLHFYRGDGANLGDPAAWAEKAHLDFSEANGLGPWYDGAPMLIDESDRLFAIVSRARRWSLTTEATDLIQGLIGEIDGADLVLDPPADLGLPYPGGPGPNSNAFADLTIGTDGRLWIGAQLDTDVLAPSIHLLYGDELAVGGYRYTVSQASAAGETGPGSYSAILTKAEATVPSAPSNLTLEAGGSFGAARHWFRGTYYGEAEEETTGGTVAEKVVSEIDAPCAIRMRLPVGCLENGGYRVYHAVGATLPDESSFLRCYEVTKADLPEDRYVIIMAPGSGPAMPTENTLPAQRVRVKSAKGGPGTTQRKVYRTQAGDTGYGYVGSIPGNDPDTTWDDDTGPDIGAAPPNAPQGLKRALATGISNAPQSWTSGVTWEIIIGWGNDNIGERLGIVPLSGETALLIYTRNGQLCARARRAADDWSAEVLIAGGAYSYRVGQAVAAGGSALISCSRFVAGDHCWGLIRVGISDGEPTVLASEWREDGGSPTYARSCPAMLGEIDDGQYVIAHGAARFEGTETHPRDGRACDVTDGNFSDASDVIDLQGAYVYNEIFAPKTHRGQNVWAIFADDEENRLGVILWERIG